MNTKRLMQVHDALGKEYQFNMDYWITSVDLMGDNAPKGESECGTCCCIGGTAQMLAKKAGEYWNMGEVAAWFDIDINIARELCYPPNNKDYSAIEIEDAKKAIMNVIVENKPMWEEIRPDLVEKW